MDGDVCNRPLSPLLAPAVGGSAMALDAKRVQAVFLAAGEAADAAAQAALLDRECGTNPELRQQVEALLQAHGARAGVGDQQGTVFFEAAPAAEEPGCDGAGERESQPPADSAATIGGCASDAMESAGQPPEQPSVRPPDAALPGQDLPSAADSSQTRQFLPPADP